MNWRTDIPTADVIVASVVFDGEDATYSDYQILKKCDRQYYTDYDKIPYNRIVKWADLEEDETVTDCNELKEEIAHYTRQLLEGKNDSFTKSAASALIDYCARHFAKWGAEHRDRFLNWIRDLIKKGIEKPEEALNILKRIDALINDDSLWGEHLKK